MDLKLFQGNRKDVSAAATTADRQCTVLSSTTRFEQQGTGSWNEEAVFLGAWSRVIIVATPRQRKCFRVILDKQRQQQVPVQKTVRTRFPITGRHRSCLCNHMPSISRDTEVYFPATATASSSKGTFVVRSGAEKEDELRPATVWKGQVLGLPDHG